MRRVEIIIEPIGQYEVWEVSVPDNAPNPITLDWVQDNVDKIEFEEMIDAGNNMMEVIGVEEKS